jgi:hypothetical protein
MSDQQTEVNYDQQYEQQHGNGEFHHEPIHAEPAATYGITPSSSPPKREPKRAWPLAARLAVAVLIIGLATITVMSLISLRTVTKRATDASQIANSQQASLNTMRGQLAALQAKAATPAPKLHLPAGLQHYGVCLVRTTDNATGDLANITLVTPVVTGSSYSCPQGNLISVVPGG